MAYTEEEKRAVEALHRDFVARLAGTAYGMRYTDED